MSLAVHVLWGRYFVQIQENILLKLYYSGIVNLNLLQLQQWQLDFYFGVTMFMLNNVTKLWS
jgi:hypothetical protein